MGLIQWRARTQITLNGVPLTRLATGHVSTLRLTDSAGFVSDTAEITFTNMGLRPPFDMPAPGAEIGVALGYLGALFDMGVFVADEIEESAPPRLISVVARAKAQGTTRGGMAPIHSQRTRSWPAGMTLGAIVETIAAQNGLTARVSEAARALVPGHIDQIDESDLAVLTRVALARDLVAKPAGGVLYVGRRGETANATKPFFTKGITRWSMRRSLGDVVGTVIATYRDLDAGKDIEVKVGDQAPVRRLRGRWRDKAEARAMAEAEARRASRCRETLDIEMPGRPDIAAETRIAPMDFSPAATGDWLVTRVVHDLSEAGFRTQITAERPE